MRYFNENQPYWGNTTQMIIGKDEYRLTARSVKIFADGALRTGGAAVRLGVTSLACAHAEHCSIDPNSSMNPITIIQRRPVSCVWILISYLMSFPSS